MHRRRPDCLKAPLDGADLVVPPGVSLDAPGLYRWTVFGLGAYVGVYGHKRRPLTRYSDNVRDLLAGQPYHGKDPDGFRPIHRALLRAVQEGRPITLTILENVAGRAERHARERALIAQYGSLNVPAFGVRPGP